MPIPIVCTSCKAKLKVKDDQEGKTIKCPKCATALEVKVPELEPEEIADEPEDAKKVEKKDTSQTKKKEKSDQSKTGEGKETSDDADESEKADGESADDKPRKKKKKKKAKKGLSVPVLVGIGALLVGGVAALVYFVFLKGDTPSGSVAKAPSTPVSDKDKNSGEKSGGVGKNTKIDVMPPVVDKKDVKKDKSEPKTDGKKKVDNKKDDKKGVGKKTPAKDAKFLKAAWDKIVNQQPIAEIEKTLGEGKASNSKELAKLVYGKESYADRKPLEKLAAGVPNPVIHCWYAGTGALVVIASKEQPKVLRAIFLERRPEGVVKHILNEFLARKNETEKL